VSARSNEIESERQRRHAETVAEERDAARRQAEVAMEEARIAASGRDAARQQAEVAMEEARIAASGRDSARRQAEVAMEQAEGAMEEARIAMSARDTALREAEEAHRARLAAEDALREGSAEARRQADIARQTADMFLSSTSWRLTAPIRFLGRLLRR